MIKITEGELKKIIVDTIKSVISESVYDKHDNFVSSNTLYNVEETISSSEWKMLLKFMDNYVDKNWYDIENTGKITVIDFFKNISEEFNIDKFTFYKKGGLLEWERLTGINTDKEKSFFRKK